MICRKKQVPAVRRPVRRKPLPEKSGPGRFPIVHGQNRPGRRAHDLKHELPPVRRKEKPERPQRIFVDRFLFAIRPNFEIHPVRVLARGLGGKKHAAAFVVPGHVNKIRVGLPEGKGLNLVGVQIIKRGDRRLLAKILDEKPARETISVNQSR